MFVFFCSSMSIFSEFMWKKKLAAFVLIIVIAKHTGIKKKNDVIIYSQTNYAVYIFDCIKWFLFELFIISFLHTNELKN